MAEPLTLRYNNPGALEYKPWMAPYGATVGPNGRYAQFSTPDQGYNVMNRVLDTYQQKHGLNTVGSIINRWAPPNVDNNSTGTYAASVASKLGVSPDQQLTPEHRPALMRAMAHYEAGKPFPEYQASQIEAKQPEPAAPQQQAQSMIFPQQDDNGGLAGMFRNAIENPLVMAGLGLVSSSAQGKDVGTGLINGIGLSREADKWAQERKKTAALQQLLAGNGQGMEGVPPALMAIARATGDPSPIAQHIIKGGGTDDIKEYEYARARGFTGSLQDWLVNKRATSGEYAKQLVYGTDKDGNIVPMQAGSRGDLVQSKMPNGVSLQRDPLKIETATGTVLIDPTTRQQMGYIPKNVAEGERQKQVGEAQGKALVDLPKVESSSKALMEKIQKVENDPNLGNVTGWQGWMPTLRAESRDTEARIAQLGGSAFLQAFESLKGGGAITEVEGQKATQALARLTDLKQSDAGYRESLRDFAQEVARLQELAQVKARNGIAPQQPQAATAPQQKFVPTQQEAPAEAVTMLRSNPTPQAMQQYDQVFGPGAAQRVLGGQ